MITISDLNLPNIECDVDIEHILNTFTKKKDAAIIMIFWNLLIYENTIFNLFKEIPKNEKKKNQF